MTNSIDDHLSILEFPSFGFSRLLSIGWPTCLVHAAGYILFSRSDLVIVDVRDDTFQPIISLWTLCYFDE